MPRVNKKIPTPTSAIITIVADTAWQEVNNKQLEEILAVQEFNKALNLISQVSDIDMKKIDIATALINQSTNSYHSNILKTKIEAIQRLSQFCDNEHDNIAPAFGITIKNIIMEQVQH